MTNHRLAPEQSVAAIRSAEIVLDLHVESLEELIESQVDRLIAAGKLRQEKRERIVGAVLARERRGTSAIGNATAIPHARLDELDRPVLCFARLADPLNLDAPDGRATRFVFLLLSPGRDAEQHLELLLAIAQLMSNTQFHKVAALARELEEFRAGLDEYGERIAAPTVHERPVRPDTFGLQRTGRLAGGLIDDVRRRARHYASDFLDGIHPKAVATTIFLFFACLAPAVAFGGLMSTLTDGQIGAMEMLVVSAIGGVAYALFSGQPLIIMGGTGPLLVFTGVLFEVCETLSLPFLPAYAWVGLWTAVLVLLVAVLDLSSLIRYFTRFTDEIFAFLISVIFIYEAVRNLAALWRTEEADHHTALVSWVLAGGTFIVATQLRVLRKSRYLRPRIREFLADFGSVIAIATMMLAASAMHYADLPVLAVPTTVTTTSGRPWLVDLGGLPLWAIFACIVPAVFCAVLVYLDQNITARLVNRTENRLEKGPAYHLDLAVTSILMAVASVFGLPWLVAATVRSLNHIMALATVEESVDSTGGVRENIVHVRETRVTGIAIHLLIGASVFLFPALAQLGIEIPMSVIFGLFVYMGVSSLVGNQFWERLKMWAVEPGQYPSMHYVRRVGIRKVHLFTAVQVLCFAVLWIVKTSALALIFPMMIAALVPVRLLLGRAFTPHELAMLDSEEAPEEELLREAGA